MKDNTVSLPVTAVVTITIGILVAVIGYQTKQISDMRKDFNSHSDGHPDKVSARVDINARDIRDLKESHIQCRERIARLEANGND